MAQGSDDPPGMLGGFGAADRLMLVVQTETARALAAHGQVLREGQDRRLLPLEAELRQQAGRLGAIEARLDAMSLDSGEVSGIRERDIGQEHRLEALERARQADTTPARLDRVERLAWRAAVIGPLAVSIILLLRAVGLLG